MGPPLGRSLQEVAGEVLARVSSVESEWSPPGAAVVSACLVSTSFLCFERQQKSIGKKKEEKRGKEGIEFRHLQVFHKGGRERAISMRNKSVGFKKEQKLDGTEMEVYFLK